MAKAVISGIVSSNIDISKIILFDKNTEQYADISKGRIPFEYSLSEKEAVSSAELVLLSVKPQNYKEVLEEISQIDNCNEKIYISIGAGITSQSVSYALNNACVIRVLPNVPMLIGEGVSVICQSNAASTADFDFVCSIFRSAGSILIIDENEMNRIIGRRI